MAINQAETKNSNNENQFGSNLINQTLQDNKLEGRQAWVKSSWSKSTRGLDFEKPNKPGFFKPAAEAELQDAENQENQVATPRLGA